MPSTADIQGSDLQPLTLAGDWAREVATFDSVMSELTIRHRRDGGHCDVGVRRPRSAPVDVRDTLFTRLAVKVGERTGRHSWEIVYDELVAKDWTSGRVSMRSEEVPCEVVETSRGWAAVCWEERAHQWVELIATGDVALADIRLVPLQPQEIASMGRHRF